MIFVLAWRTLLTRPIRSAVLAGGFGLGVSVMAALLGIGEVILEQARSPALVGGGDVVVSGATGRVTTARFVLGAVLRQPPFAERVRVASPSARGALYLIKGERTVPIRIRAGVPSLERALGDAEIAAIDAWRDTPADARWREPGAADVLAALDRFHPIPDVPARAESWAEWLYFNGQSGSTRFYLTFLVGPKQADGRRAAGVRLQLDAEGRHTNYSAGESVDEATVLRDAPNLTIAGNSVRLDGDVYRVSLDLPVETATAGGDSAAGARASRAGLATRDGSRITGTLSLRATLGQSLPPIWIRGAGGWVSGYTVPVMAGALAGTLEAGPRVLSFDGATGYHDHNWGFWDGVTWRWGQVQHEGRSFVYGRVIPPPDAADASRVPGFLAAIGPAGLIGYTTDVTIDEESGPDADRPARIVVRGRGSTVDLTMALDVRSQVVTPMGSGLFGAGLDFLQLRADYAVRGRLGAETVAFTAAGSAETFRGGEKGTGTFLRKP